MSAIPGVLEVPGGGGFELRMRVEVLANSFLTGAALALLTLALPHGGAAHATGTLACALAALAAGGLLRWRAQQMPRCAVPLALALGSALVAAAAWCSGQAPSPLVLLFTWVFLYAAYFLSLPVAIAESAWAGLLYGALLAARPPADGALAWWLVGLATLATVAVVIRLIRRRTERLIARLSDAARTDALTGLPNRRGFRELLDLELERARRAGQPTSLLIGDVDHFKDVNDRLGHHAGDAVLQRVAALLREGLRQIDLPARIGGEELAVILPGTDAEGAYLVAERLRAALRDAFADASVPITISFGLAAHPADAETASSLVRAADEALYGAKESGRNRSVVHSPALRELVRCGRPEQDVAAERFVAVVLDLAEAVDVRFSGSVRHSETVGRYAELMARELGLSERRVGRVRLAGLLHDVGKVGVPDAILRKAGPLTGEERAAIAQHPALGAQILEHPSLADVQLWVGAHHERPDGKGYPHGLAGEALPLEARVVAVADAYEAMTSDRSYRDAIGHERARAELRRHAGTQFDARVVAALLAVLEREAERAAELSPAAVR